MTDLLYVCRAAPVGGSVNQQHCKMEQGQLWRQYVIAGIVNITIASLGFCMGWTSPINLKLTTHAESQSPLGSALTDDEIAWIGSLLPVGATFGPFAGGVAASKIGRKYGIVASCLPLLVGWVLVATAVNVYMLYVARVFWGIGIGMIFTLSPMYCAEIATDDSRGALGSFLQLFITSGFLLVYAVGPYVSYDVVAYIGLAFTVVSVVTVYVMPESPIYYLTKDDKEGAIASLQLIRGKSRDGVMAEIELREFEIAASKEKSATFSDLLERGNFKAMYTSCFLVFFQQFCGINAVLFYMTDIFEASGSNLSSDIATIIVGAVQFGSSAVTPFVVDRLGRRLLMLFSSVGTAIGLGLLGMYFILAENDHPVAESIGFIPVLSLVLFIVTYCVGLGPLPWAIMGELFPIEVKAIAAPIATAFCWLLSFLVTRFFSPVARVLGMSVAFWIFGVCCVLSFLFTMFFVPETKGKSNQEIQDMLRGRTTTKAGKA